MTRDRPAVVAAAAAGLLFVPLIVPILTFRVLRQGDLAQFHIPLRYLYAKALVAGDSVIWSRAIFSGFYLHGEGQLGMWHPLHWLDYRLLPFTYAFDAELLAGYVAAFAGMTFLLRRVPLTRAASIVGGAAFAFSGFNLLHMMHMNMVAVGAHIPWLLLAVDVLLSEPKRSIAAGGFVLLSATLASALLLGFPQCVWMGGLVTAVFAIVRAASLRAWNRLAWSALAAAAGIVAAAAQLLPTMDVLAESTRQTFPPEYGLTYSLHPLNLLQLWSPYIFANRVYALPTEPYVHEFGVYDGAFCTIAFAWVLARWRDLGHRRVAAAGIALCLIGLVLALGSYGGVYSLLRHLPLLEKFRAPARHMLLMHLGFAILAAVTFEDLERLARRRGEAVPRAVDAVAAVVLVAGATAVLAVAYSATHAVLPVHRALPWRLAASVTVVALTALFVGQAARGKEWALLCLPLCLALDLAAWGYGYVWTAPPMRVRLISTLIPMPPDARPGDRLAAEDFAGLSNVALLRGFDLLSGYAGLEPRKALPLDSTTRRIAGVRWAFKEGAWVPVDRPMPRVRVVRDARVTTNPERDIQQIDIARTALVANDVGTLQGDEAPAAVTVDRPGRLDVDVGGTGRRLLVTTESYHAGWRASEGQRALATERVNGDFLGVIVEDGVKHVTLVFDAWSARMGRRVSASGIALTLIGALVLSFREQRPRRRP